MILIFRKELAEVCEDTELQKLLLAVKHDRQKWLEHTACFLENNNHLIKWRHIRTSAPNGSLLC